MYESLVAVVPPIPPTSTDLLALRAHCRVDQSDPDAALLLPIYLQAARAWASSYLKQTFYETSYTLIRDTLPGRMNGFWTGAPAHLQFWNRISGSTGPDSFFRVLNPPLISVDSIEYLDPEGNLQTMDSSLYTVVPGFPGRIAPSYATIWPLTLPQIGAVTLNYTCGYGSTTTTVSLADGTTTTTAVTTGPGFSTPLTTTTTASTVDGDTAGVSITPNVPFNVQAAVLLWAAHLYRNREAVVDGTMNEMPLGVRSLLNSASKGYYR